MARLGFAVVAVVLVTAAAGCGKEADGSSSEPSRSSSTSSDTSKATATPSTSTPGTSEPSKESGPKPPRLPDKAKGTSAKSAAHFVEYYIELMNYSAATGDTKAMRAASRDCETCKSYMRLYEKTYRNGGHSGNPGWKPRNAISQRLRDHVTVLIEVKTRAFRFKPNSRATESKVKSAYYQLRFEVVSTRSGWKVSVLEDRPEAP